MTSLPSKRNVQHFFQINLTFIDKYGQMVIIFHMKNSLKEKYPELLQIWDYDHNPQSPQEVSFGSNLIVNWKCPNCSYSYPRTISNQVKIFKTRKLNNICPICRGKRIIPGYNSLKAKYPSLVESEWDYDKNEVLPEHIAPHANKNGLNPFFRCI